MLSLPESLSMCGRYRLLRPKQLVEEDFDTADWQDDWSPRYNIAPTQPVPVIRQSQKTVDAAHPLPGVSLFATRLHWRQRGRQLCDCVRIDGVRRCETSQTLKVGER